MKKHILLFIIVIGCLFSACYEDLGNYDYKEVPTLSIKDYIKDFERMVFVGDTIHAEPILEYQIDSTAFDLEYEWYLGNFRENKKKISTEKCLTYKVDTNGMLFLKLYMKDKNTGITWSNSDKPLSIMSRDISSNKGIEGWYVLSEENGSSCLSFLAFIKTHENDEVILTVDETKNIYEKINANEKLGGQPVGLMDHWLQGNSMSSNEPEQLLILQNGGLGPVYVDAHTFEKSLLLKDVFINGTLPAGAVWKQACANPLNHFLLTENGDLYGYGVEDPEVWFSGKFMDMPIQISGGMKISHMVRPLYKDSRVTLLYDEKNHRFLWIYSDQYDDMSALNIVQLVEENPLNTTMSINEPLIDIVYIGGYSKQITYDADQYYLLIYKDKRTGSETYGQYCMLNFRFTPEEPMYNFLATTFWERAFPRQDMINDQTLFYCVPNSHEYLMFTSGTQNNELWGYIFGNEGLKAPIRLYNFGNDPIVCINAQYENDWTGLSVATKSGKIYFFEISGESFRGDITPIYISKENYGKVKEVRYKGTKGYAI